MPNSALYSNRILSAIRLVNNPKVCSRSHVVPLVVGLSSISFFCDKTFVHIFQPDDYVIPTTTPQNKTSNSHEAKEKDDLDDLFNDLNPDDGLDL